MDGYITIGTEIESKNFDEEIKQTEAELKRLSSSYDKALNNSSKYKVNEKAMADLRIQIEKTSNKLVDLRNKQEKLNQNQSSGLKEWLNSCGQKTDNNIKKVARWALTFLGVSSAINFVRNSISTLSEYNEQINTDLSYIRFAIASVLQPVVEGLIKLVYKLLIYVGYIAKAWFGVNIFANASTNAFNKSVKKAKEIKNQLSGFDEMNVLSDNSNTNDSSSNVATPSFDLSSPEDMPIPSWIKWIADNKDLLISALAGIAGGLLALKFGATELQALGIGLMIAGVVYTISALLDYLKDPSWENFGKIIQGIGIFIVGLGITIGSLPVVIAGVIVLIIGTIIKYWDKIKDFLQSGIDWLTGKSDWIHDKFGDTIGAIYDTFVEGLQWILDGFDDFFTGVKEIFDGIIKFIVGVFTGDWKKAWEGVKQIFSGLFTSLIGIVKVVVGTILSLVVTVAQGVGATISAVFKAVINGILLAIETILNSPIKAVNALIGVINKVPGINLGKLSTFKLPRLAKGGIVNMPGRGVPIGSAIGGESGQEGVIPLTDEQQMAILGESIGKHVTLYATIINKLDNRTISRQQTKINNQLAFAKNGG